MFSEQKRWHTHTAHTALHKDATIFNAPRALSFIEDVGKPTLLRKIAAELPGVGVGRSALVEKHFGSVYNMFMATEKDWLKIDGVGKVTARMSWEALHHE